MTRREEHPIIGAIRHAMAEVQGSSALRMDRDRPYDGQPHTDNGIRGKTLVHGLTMRDISDCFVKGLLDAGGIEVNEHTIHDDIYRLDLDDIDPGAAIQNAMCWIERYMGIYPNIPKLEGDVHDGA